MKNYELFTGMDLEIADKIQRLRYQLLIHSCIYYHLNTSSVSDAVWDKWAKELKQLQSQYPHISMQVTLYEYFQDWDASTGAFLPITLSWVVTLAKRVLDNNVESVSKKVIPKKLEKRKLF